MWHKGRWLWGAALMVVVLLCGMGLGWWLATDQPTQTAQRIPWEIPLRADSAVVSDRYAVATGPVDDEVEGLFLLDFATGQLQCSVLNLRTSKFAAVIQGNVLQDLPAPAGRRNPRYLLTTGQIALVRAGRMPRFGRSVAYVLDATTGNYAAYALQWRPELAASGRPQVGNFILLDTGNMAPMEQQPQDQPPQRP